MHIELFSVIVDLQTQAARNNSRNVSFMKKVVILLFIILPAFSCTKEIHPLETNVYEFSVNAQLSDFQSEETKATGENIIRLSWSKGDKISVVNITTNKVLGGSLSAVSSGYSSIFTGSLTGTIRKGDKLSFIYPCQNYSQEGDFAPIDIDYSIQTTKNPNLAMVAYYTTESDANSFTDVSVKFAFQMSFLRINLSELPVLTELKEVRINGVNDKLTFSIDKDEIKATTTSKNGYIKCNASGVETDSRGSQTVFIGVIETPKVESRSITVVTPTSEYSAYFPAAALNKNKPYNTNANGFVQSLLTFKDASVRAKCIELFDANGDGQLSFLEAAAVTDLGVALTKAAGQNPFATSILHFAEMQFFTGLSTIPSFQGYTMLKTIAIPPQIKAVPSNAFNGCTALETVIFTSTTPPAIEANAFTGCDPHIAYYVPTGSVTAYKEALPSMAGAIHDIAEVGTDFGLEGWSDGGSIGGSAN